MVFFSAATAPASRALPGENDVLASVQDQRGGDVPLAQGIGQMKVLVGELLEIQPPRTNESANGGLSPTVTATTLAPHWLPWRASRYSAGCSRTQESHHGAQKVISAGCWPTVSTRRVGWLSRSEDVCGHGDGPDECSPSPNSACAAVAAAMKGKPPDRPVGRTVALGSP
jgi:hypothetical protein